MTTGEDLRDVPVLLEGSAPIAARDLIPYASQVLRDICATLHDELGEAPTLERAYRFVEQIDTARLAELFDPAQDASSREMLLSEIACFAKLADTWDGTRICDALVFGVDR